MSIAESSTERDHPSPARSAGLIGAESPARLPAWQIGGGPSFDGFVVCRGNDDACRLARSWSEGGLASVLVLAGATRSGKTHLASAARSVLEAQGRRVVTLDLACWADLLTSDGPAGEGPPFRERMAAADALVVEHLEALSDRDPELECLWRPVLRLRSRGCPVLLTVTRVPPRSGRILRWLRRQGDVHIVSVRRYWGATSAASDSPVQVWRPLEARYS